MDTVLIIGASRGIGLGLAREFARQGWRVIGTVRAPGSALEREPAIQVEHVDINVPSEVAALRERLAGERIDLLFVNAGIANGPEETLPGTSTQAFIDLMLTNALSPLRVIEAFADLVPANGVIAAMSSGLGSVGNNTRAGWEIYRASKAALNTLLRSFAVRRGAGRTVLAVVPGWVKTDMGGSGAMLEIETSVRGIVAMLALRRGQPGAAYVDWQNQDITW